MKWLMVGKTSVPFGSEPQFLLLHEESESRPVRRFRSLAELTEGLKATRATFLDNEIRCVKNDLPALIWKSDDTLPDHVDECVRLSADEVRELAKLLRQ